MYKIVGNESGGETVTIVGAFGIVSAVSSQPWFPEVRALLTEGREAEAVKVHKEHLANAGSARAGTSVFEEGDDDDLFE